MTEREVLQAAFGNTGPLAKLQGRERLEEALRAAAAGGLMGPLGSLLRRRKEVEAGAKTMGGQTALHWAARGGHAAAVEALLRAGAQVGARDGADATPLHSAAQGGHAAAVEALLRAGAQVGATDRNGKTALDLKGHEQVAELLYQAPRSASSSLQMPSMPPPPACATQPRQLQPLPLPLRPGAGSLRLVQPRPLAPAPLAPMRLAPLSAAPT